MSARRPLTPTEERLVEAVRREVATLDLTAEETSVVLDRVRDGLTSRRPPTTDEHAPSDRVPPSLVARAVAGVARPSLRPDRDVASVRVADATPRDLLEELRRRLRPSRRAGRARRPRTTRRAADRR